MKTTRFERYFAESKRGIRNWLNDIRIKRWAKANDIHKGTVQVFKGGIWLDKEDNLYNCMGKRIGKIQWEES